MNEIIANVIIQVAQQNNVPLNHISRNMTLKDTLGMSSMDLVHTISQIDTALGLKPMPHGTQPLLHTVGDVIKLYQATINQPKSNHG